MLVLSRGPKDKIVFPHLGISVEILRIGGNRVKVGIDAPADVAVLRHELAGAINHDLPTTSDGKSRGESNSAAQRERHERRNRLNSACLLLSLAEKQLNAGMDEEALESLGRGIRQLETFESEAPAGATSPLRRTTQNAAPQPVAEPPTAPAKPRALLVDDDANESELLAGYLRLSGFEVDTAFDGLQAMVQLARSDRPDLVLMDMNMPRMNGARTVETIRRNRDYDGVRLFAVTGEDVGAGGVTVGPKGVDRWFTKPIKPAELVGEMTRAFAGRC